MSTRLYVPALDAGSLAIAGDDHHYLFRVLRLAVGDRLTLFDGDGCEAEATVRRVGGRDAELEVGPPRQAAEPAGPAITALLPLIKGERSDWALGKLVELGVRRVVPVRCSRGVVKVEGERAEARRQRYQKLAIAAARQCRAAHLCRVEPVADFRDAVASAPAGLRLMAWEGGGAAALTTALAGAAAPAVITLATGPEGGFAEAEVEFARAAGFVPVNLGPRILRAETAAVTLAAVIGFALGDLSGRKR